MRTGVYQIRNVINGKVYVGSTSTGIANRWSQHKRDLKKGVHHNRFLQRAWNKGGEESFVFEILEECPPEACVVREQVWLNVLLKKVGRIDQERCYNLSAVADSTLGVRYSEEVRKKMSSMRLGPKSYMYGKHHPAEVRKKISDANMGKQRSEETCKKIAEARRGKHPSAETCRKMAASRSGENHYLFGKHLSEETRKKMSEARKGVFTGERGSKAILTWDQVREIRRLYAEGSRQCDLARMYHVKRPAVWKIVNNKTWKE